MNNLHYHQGSVAKKYFNNDAFPGDYWALSIEREFPLEVTNSLLQPLLDFNWEHCEELIAGVDDGFELVPPLEFQFRNQNWGIKCDDSFSVVELLYHLPFLECRTHEITKGIGPGSSGGPALLFYGLSDVNEVEVRAAITSIVEALENLLLFMDHKSGVQ